MHHPGGCVGTLSEEVFGTQPHLLSSCSPVSLPAAVGSPACSTLVWMVRREPAPPREPPDALVDLFVRMIDLPLWATLMLQFEAS